MTATVEPDAPDLDDERVRVDVRGRDRAARRSCGEPTAGFAVLFERHARSPTGETLGVRPRPLRRGQRSAGGCRGRRRRASAWQSASASASAASAGCGSCVQPQDAGDHGLHLPLVGGAVARDRGLDLGRACAWPPGSPRSPAISRAMPLACAVPMTECRLCCAKTRSTATTVRSVLVDHRADAGGDRGEPTLDRARRDRSGSTPTCTSVAERSRATSTTPTPQRVRPGSMPRTRRAATPPR